jgi:exopolysaccharide biosynthesis protein
MALSLILALAAALPLSPQPAAPFPKIITDAPVFQDVAPGIRFGDYKMRTADGPLDVRVLAVDLHDPSVRIGTALASGKLVSSGETVSSMAQRTGAVAGVNGDYFDINQTNQPLNILVQDGRLVRMPMQRWAIAFDSAKNPSFSEFAVNATATLPQGVFPLKTINDWPPPGGGAVFDTPEYGALRPLPNVTELQLTPVSGVPPFATYRVTGIADNTQQQPPGYYLAIGPNAYSSVPLPQTGDAVTISGTATPSLDSIVSAIGGGPLLVKDGAWYADPDGPNKGEFLTHMPATSVALTREGTMLLFEIDGRQPALSIGVLQPQLAQLMIAFGAVTGMQFDGGGSSTIVARLPGDTYAAVQNSPSDGQERRVGDALLVYSDAPYGPPAKISTMPQIVRAMPGARVPLDVAVTDASGHTVQSGQLRFTVLPGNAGRMDGDTFVAGSHAGDASIRIQSGELRSEIPVHVTDAVAYAQLLPEHPALRAGETLQLQARAFNAQGYPVALPATLGWTATAGHVTPSGAFTAANGDATVALRLGSTRFSEVVTVGEHESEIPVVRYAQFATAPRGESGGIDRPDGCACLALQYDFTGRERAAYANASIVLPERALGIAADVYGDGNGETLRLAVNNAINERFLYTVSKIKWKGWRRLEFRFPAALPQPITFKSLYVIDKVGPEPAIQAQGSISLRNVRVILAGSAASVNK